LGHCDSFCGYFGHFGISKGILAIGDFEGIFVILEILRIFSHFRGFRDIFVNFLDFKCILIILEALRVFG
jgi:hypothetical protein